MAKYKVILFFIIIILALGAGFYFNNYLIKFYDNLLNSSTLKQVGKEILTPPPLNIGGIAKQVVLTKDKIISETNSQRQENGDLPALTENQTLDRIALLKASDLFTNQYFEHVSPSGVGPGELAQKNGYQYIVEGENLILGNFSSEAEAVQDWMNSPGHRANILNNRFTEIGVAIIKGTYKGDSVWIGVQEFGLPLSDCSEPNEALKSEIDLNEKTLNNMSSQISQIRSEISNLNPGSENYNEVIDQYNQLVNNYNDLSATTKNVVSQYNEEVNNFNNCVVGK